MGVPFLADLYVVWPPSLLVPQAVSIVASSSWCLRCLVLWGYPHKLVLLASLCWHVLPLYWVLPCVWIGPCLSAVCSWLIWHDRCVIGSVPVTWRATTHQLSGTPKCHTCPSSCGSVPRVSLGPTTFFCNWTGCWGVRTLTYLVLHLIATTNWLWSLQVIIGNPREKWENYLLCLLARSINRPCTL